MDPDLGAAARLNCYTCGAVAWRGGRVEETDDGGRVTGLPFGDGQEVLTDYADRSCPQGGVGCPHTTTARAAAAEAAPVALRRTERDALLALRDRVAALERRP